MVYRKTFALFSTFFFANLLVSMLIHALMRIVFGPLDIVELAAFAALWTWVYL